MLFVFRAVSILPNRIIGTVGEHPGFPVEALSLSHCGQWLASCSHDQLIKFSDIREVLTHKVDGHRRLRRTDQRKVLSSKVAAELNFFGDLDPDKGECSKQTVDRSCSEDDSSHSESEDTAEIGGGGKVASKSRDAGVGVVGDTVDNADIESDDNDDDDDDDDD